MKEIYRLKSRPAGRPENEKAGERYRITMLTERLIRLEYAPDGQFEDRATQMVLNRDFPSVQYTVKETEDQLEIFTRHLHLIYNKQEFSSFGLSIRVLGNMSNYHSIWHYGEEIGDLGGTARTLDRTDGPCPLGPGLMSRLGFSVLDDSRALLLSDDGWVEPRKKGVQDLYFFGYGHDYLSCLDDFFYLCGRTPMLPRFALGNWWSRYYEYTEESYRALMKQFDEEGVPFTVAVVDMDWHLVDVDPKYGSGWTGYTWNRRLFPDPKRFMDWLHSRGMRVTLNVHPADGVRAYEEQYPRMAQAMGIDPESGEPVNFDISDPNFLEAYFTLLHHPNEEMGVDFWWLDWQQGQNSRIEGLDPLWMLNHFHYLDNGRDGKRPMTFSRYAGPGSHRYPAGFSGDTLMTWRSLEFQPYFTATASNIGYGWWSHDIGGHMLGVKDDEMVGRWVQFGVFSPLMRLHSTKDEFNGKEPWRFKYEIRRMMGEFLRLRHQMIPYLYTMNHRAFQENRPIMEPMYYRYPEESAAYERKNQYFFGSELLVAPITSPMIRGLNVAKVKAWLPEGIWFDLFTGMTYQGGRRMELYRGIDTMPVFAKAGAIVPFTDEIFGEDASLNPQTLTLKVFAGADGAFELYEDDNDTQRYLEGVCAKTRFSLRWSGERQSFVIAPAEFPTGEKSLIPAARAYRVELYGCGEIRGVRLFAGGKERTGEISEIYYDQALRRTEIALPEISVDEEIRLEFGERLALAPNRVCENVYDFLNQAEIAFSTKSEIYRLVKSGAGIGTIAGELRVMDVEYELAGCILELLKAYGDE